MAEDGRRYHQEHHLVSVKAAEDPEKLPTIGANEVERKSPG